MVRMATIIHRYHIRHLNALEDAPHDTLSHYITLSLLFGREAQDAGVCVCVYTHTHTHTHTRTRTHTHIRSEAPLGLQRRCPRSVAGLFYSFSRSLLLL